MAAGKQIEVITSGTLAPTLEKAIALGYVPKSLSKTYLAKVVKKPFYRRK